MQPTPANETRATFAQRVRATREERQLSQEHLARLLDQHGLQLDATAITRLERGSRAVRIEEAAALADVLGVGLADLLRPEKPPLRERLDEERRAEAVLRQKQARLENEAEKAGINAELFEHRSRYLEALLAYQETGNPTKLIDALGAGLYFGDEKQFRLDLLTAGLPEDALRQVEEGIWDEVAGMPRSDETRAIDNYVYVFISRLFKALGLVRDEGDSDDGEHRKKA